MDDWFFVLAYKYRKIDGANDKGPTLYNFIKVIPTCVDLQDDTSIYVVNVLDVKFVPNLEYLDAFKLTAQFNIVFRCGKLFWRVVSCGRTLRHGEGDERSCDFVCKLAPLITRLVVFSTNRISDKMILSYLNRIRSCRSGCGLEVSLSDLISREILNQAKRPCPVNSFTADYFTRYINIHTETTSLHVRWPFEFVISIHYSRFINKLKLMTSSCVCVCLSFEKKNNRDFHKTRWTESTRPTTP